MALAAHGFGAPEILAHRAVWSVFVAGLVLLLAGQWGEARRVLATPRTLAWLALSALLIGTNWSLYVFATTHHATLEASLGYYINPLLNMAAGAVLFREKIDRWSALAIALAAVGVVIQTIALGHVPIIGLTLAVTFCAYAVIRKRVPASAQTGLFVECLVLLPIGAVFLAWLTTQGQAVGFRLPLRPGLGAGQRAGDGDPAGAVRLVGAAPAPVHRRLHPVPGADASVRLRRLDRRAADPAADRLLRLHLGRRRRLRPGRLQSQPRRTRGVEDHGGTGVAFAHTEARP
jgi:uncharacterized membrane protein